jgi:hypothetical protein
MPTARRTTCVQSSVMRNVVTARFKLKRNCLTVNTLHACFALWILKHIFVRRNAVKCCPVNTRVPMFVLQVVEIAKFR